MRRNYISPEFVYQKVHGTLNMQEQSTFFCSKMLEIDDSIIIQNENIIWYQQPNGEQIDLDAESKLQESSYDSVIIKKDNHNLILDDSQTDFDKEQKARWIINIQIKSVLKDWIFANMKRYRTFEGVQNFMTLNNNVDAAIRDYIDKNVMNRYKFTRVELFLQSIPLLSIGSLKYNNSFNASIEAKQNIFTKFQSETDPNQIDIKLTFNQPEPASQYAFNYYFNLYFEKL